MNVKKCFAAFLCTAALLLNSSPLHIFAENSSDSSETDYSISDETENTQETAGTGYMFTLPDNMRACVITPGVDYFTSDEDTAEALSAELEKIFANFSKIGLNTVIINTIRDERSYYSIDMNAGEELVDPTAIAVQTAYNFGISPYVVLDLSHLMLDSASTAQIDTLISRVHRFALKYPCDGIILDDYYVCRNADTFSGYMNNGSGVGYTNWLYDTADQLFSSAADVIHLTDNSIAVGFMINDMWANSSVNELGSDTSDSVQAYYDGYSDTKSFIEKGYTDFALIRAYGSLTDEALPFENVTGWWGSLAAEYDMPIYIVHYNEKIGTSETGWGAEDQLLKQLTVAKKLDSYQGSVFNLYERLTQNPLDTTSTLTSYFNEQINEESLFSDLKVVSPAKFTFTTSEPSVTFMGSFDSNFPVYFNNSPIQLNDAGNFYFTRDLKVGLNTFTITHKSKTYTYKIERKIVVMQTIATAISEGKTLRVDGGTKINLSVTAYKGSKIYGVVNGTTVKMTEQEGKTDDEDYNSSYVRYTGSYTAPKGIVNEEQNLGTIKICGENSGFSMEVIGAKVIVNAEPEPVIKKEAEMTDANSAGSGEIIGTLESIYKSTDSIKYVKVNSDYTIVYDGKTADDIPSPVFSQLPAGTIEPYKSTSGNYYLTMSGKRIAASAASLVDGTGIEKNALFVKSIGTSNGKSYIRISADYKIGFNMQLVGNNYYTDWEGDYYLKSFTATHLYITFENVTSVTKLPSFENNLVFKSGKWDTVTEANGTKFRLILELRQPGVYSGHSATYTADGDLMLNFPVPTNSLSGLTVVVDPGHGYGKSATTIDPGAVGEVVEQEVVLAISKELTSQLKAAGANVVRLKTESQFLLTKERPIYARGYGCDIYLSIHANKSLVDGSARGVEVYYFTSYSQPLAAKISESIATYYANYAYADGAYRDRGAKYSYFQVTLQQDFPSVLVETGFVNEINDAMTLASPTHQKGIAAAIVTGIKNYLSRSSISYASDGSSNADYTENDNAVTEDNNTEDTQSPESSEEELDDPEETDDLSGEITSAPEDTVYSDSTTVPDDFISWEDTTAAEVTTDTTTLQPPDTGNWGGGGIPSI